ncbi:hypothetical protein WA026_003989 [Henosepilachna vigintioctopunctata]|uniref:Uncharacterized protein n=1 Tax=Henosepilachna vigintioctopunctata TaxID=420089 RepID=A0AAW1UG73_9CUCU
MGRHRQQTSTQPRNSAKHQILNNSQIINLNLPETRLLPFRIHPARARITAKHAVQRESCTLPATHPLLFYGSLSYALESMDYVLSTVAYTSSARRRHTLDGKGSEQHGQIQSTCGIGQSCGDVNAITTTTTDTAASFIIT